MKLKRVNEMSENIEIKNDMFKTEDFIKWLTEVAPNYITKMDLEMYVDKFIEMKNQK